MAYIYRKVIGGKPYYYLRISKRVNNKSITKDIAYLGSNIDEISGKIKNIPEKYKFEIRKSFKSIKKFLDSQHYLQKIKDQKIRSDPYIQRDLLENIEAIKLHFNDIFLKQDKLTVEETYKDFIIDFAYNTTSLEGNTITLKEAEKLLRENLTPKEKDLREIFDLQNTEKAFFDLLNNDSRINEALSIRIHDRLMENIDKRKGYRSHEIRVFRSRFDASPAMYVKTDMGLLFRWYNEHKKKLHPLVLAIIFHHKFEKIHPFADGNGRTGRMVLNHILLKNGYPPLIIYRKNRAEYLKQLAQADKAEPLGIDIEYYRNLIAYIGKEYIDSYWNNFNI